MQCRWWCIKVFVRKNRWASSYSIAFASLLRPCRTVNNTGTARTITVRVVHRTSNIRGEYLCRLHSVDATNLNVRSNRNQPTTNEEKKKRKSFWDHEGTRLERPVAPEGTTGYQPQQTPQGGRGGLTVANEAIHQPQRTPQRDCSLILPFAILLTPLQEPEDNLVSLQRHNHPRPHREATPGDTDRNPRP